jgi:REP element-mobilizing transposase RayT
VGRGFARFVQRSGITIWACSIMPDHVHLVVARHAYEIEQMANLLKGDASRQLLAEGLHPFAERRRPNGRLPSCWARNQWAVYLNSEEDILRAIRYVEENPVKAGLPPQQWRCVTPYNPPDPAV